MNDQDYQVPAASTDVEWLDGGLLKDLEDGAPSLQRLGTKQCVLIRRGDTVVATEALCPHKFAPLQEGHLEDGCLVCPVHDAHFNLDSGTPREGDGWAGQLELFATEIRDGRVWVQA